MGLGAAGRYGAESLQLGWKASADGGRWLGRAGHMVPASRVLDVPVGSADVFVHWVRARLEVGKRFRLCWLSYFHVTS
jgi:hypothetical protein